jgi:hypothetical protein
MNTYNGEGRFLGGCAAGGCCCTCVAMRSTHFFFSLVVVVAAVTNSTQHRRSHDQKQPNDKEHGCVVRVRPLGRARGGCCPVVFCASCFFVDFGSFAVALCRVCFRFVLGSSVIRRKTFCFSCLRGTMRNNRGRNNRNTTGLSYVPSLPARESRFVSRDQSCRSELLGCGGGSVRLQIFKHNNSDAAVASSSSSFPSSLFLYILIPVN